MESRPGRRKRGVVLNASGIQRLKVAIAAAEALEKGGDRFTIDELSDRTGISTSTLSRLWTAKAGVDRRTLSLLFSAFQLDLTDSDIKQDCNNGTTLADDETRRVLPLVDTTIDLAIASSAQTQMKYPSGPVALDSGLYIQRSGVDDRALQEITQPGCVIRIKAPRGFGKTSLLLRLIHHTVQLDYATAHIDLQQAEPETLESPRRFLRWFCSILSVKLGQPPNLDPYWDEDLGNSLSTTLYFREALLASLQHPLVLAINEVNRLFEYPETAKTVFPLLRSWHEEAQQHAVWRRLRLVVAYSTDMYLPLAINQSPFNIGLPLSLPEFTREEVQRLASLHRLSWDGDECDRLFSMIGGHPSLIGIALYHLQQGMTLDAILTTAKSQTSIFRPHLQRLLVQISQTPQWVEALQPYVMGQSSISLDPVLAYQLEGLSLVKPTLSGWKIRCELYRLYLLDFLYQQSLD